MSSRLLRAAGIAAALCLLLTACGGGQTASPAPSASSSPVSVAPGPSASQIPDGTLVYTNLNGETAKAEVFARLTAAGVPQDDADALSAWVDDYNAVMRDCPSFTLEPEFTALQAQAVDYGSYYDMSTAWFKTGGRDDTDPLCRVAAYRLMRSFISIERTLPGGQWQCQNENQWLYSDWDVLSTYALMDLTEADQARYFTLWDPVSVSDGADEDALYQAALAQWDERGVRFLPGQVSLVTIWRQSSGGQGPACAAHAAVLIEDGEGCLLFEKTNPEAPYQATKFSSLEQVKQYMLDSLAFDLAKDGIDPGVCAVLKNDQLL